MAATTLFLLFALVQGANDAVSFTQLASYRDEAACTAAVDAVKTALGQGGTPTVEVGCISTDALGRAFH
jgi:hypothetical protein